MQDDNQKPQNVYTPPEPQTPVGWDPYKSANNTPPTNLSPIPDSAPYDASTIFHGATESDANNIPRSPKKINWLRIIIVTVVSIIAIIGSLFIIVPLIFIGTFSATCSAKMPALEKQNEVISAKLAKLTASQPNVAASSVVNGDCLTGSGSSVTLTLINNYPSYVEAQDELIELLRKQGLPTPVSKVIKNNRVSTGGAGAISGGDTDVTRFEYRLPFNEYDEYGFSYELTNTMVCDKSPTNPREIICDGNVPIRETFVPEFMAKKPIKKASVNVTFREDLYHIKE